MTNHLCTAATTTTNATTSSLSFTAAPGTVPYKQVKRRQSKKGGGKGAKTPVAGRDGASDSDGTAAGADDDALDDAAAATAGAANETSLYGQWQVQRHVPVPLVDGQVPVNAHGNFELWSR